MLYTLLIFKYFSLQIGEIRFKNYYVAVLTVKAKFRGGLTSGDSGKHCVYMSQ